ncbi:hypothetical protein [Caldilinea sp.]|uniref:hypothetical protein n=1 Tax=Caldilinea sp. TaxID=2293560 RepID=UPI002C541095|nr:hypothetical protein [Anaerolineales bacterium]HQY94990.1 hypothetical protein [Caldilinea sp.]HRA66740.1 hypothetical protein [Caldilinea sp.]
MTTQHRFSLDQPARYTIQVEGRLAVRWGEWFAPLTLTVVQDNDHHCVSTLCGTVADQAALQGMLRALYSLGLPLLLVRCERCREDASDNPSHC